MKLRTLYKKTFDHAAVSQKPVTAQDIVNRSSGSKHTYMRGWRTAVAACLAALLILTGTAAVSGAAGVGPFATLSRFISGNSGQALSETDQTRETQSYQVSLASYYYDPLGIGKFLFTVQAKDGTDISSTKNTAGSSDILKYERDNAVRTMSNCTVRTIDLGKGHVGTLGLLVECASPNSFTPDTDTLIFEYDKQDYPFDSLSYTTTELYTFEQNGQTIQVSELGMLVPDHTTLNDYLSDKVEQNKPVGTVYYHDGKKQALCMSLFAGCKAQNSAIVTFSPETDLEETLARYLNQETDLKDVQKVWDKAFSGYYLSLSNVERFRFGTQDIRLAHAD